MKSRPSPTRAPGNDKPRLARASKQIRAKIEEKFGFLPPFFTPAFETRRYSRPSGSRRSLRMSTIHCRPCSRKSSSPTSRAIAPSLLHHLPQLRPSSLGMTAAEVLALLTEPGPATEVEIGKHCDVLAAQSSPLEEWPTPGSASMKV